jgi:zinc transport system substrate-binding protein
MNRVNYVIIPILIIIVLLAGIFFIPNQKTNTRTEKDVRMIVTLVPQAQFVEKIGGEKVAVTVLVPTGASPHTYEPTPSQIEEVARADVFAKVGSGVEFELVWMDKIISVNPDMLIVDCSQNIQLLDTPSKEISYLENSHGINKDPHIWTSPRNAIVMVNNIYEGLVKINPENKDYYSDNKDAYIEDLRNLDDNLHNIFSHLKTKKFMVYHPAWGYFAHEYGLEMIPIEKEGKEPTPEGLVQLIRQAKENEVKVIFATPEFQTETAKVVANEIGGTLVLISPLEKDYIAMLTKISQEIEKSLK